MNELIKQGTVFDLIELYTFDKELFSLLTDLIINRNLHIVSAVYDQFRDDQYFWIVWISGNATDRDEIIVEFKKRLHERTIN